jgi:hypothetical protein
MLRKMSEWWVALAFIAWFACTGSLLLLGYLDVISDDVVKVGWIARYVVVIAALAGVGIWLFIEWVKDKDAPLATEEQLRDRVLKVIVGALAIIGFAGVGVFLEDTLGQGVAHVVLVLSVAALFFVLGAIRLYVRWRDRRAAGSPSP